MGSGGVVKPCPIARRAGRLAIPLTNEERGETRDGRSERRDANWPSASAPVERIALPLHAKHDAAICA